MSKISLAIRGNGDDVQDEDVICKVGFVMHNVQVKLR